MPRKDLYDENPEKHRQNRKAEYWRDPARARASAKNWREKNREKHRKYQQEWHAKNRAKAAKYQADWYAKNREAIIQRIRRNQATESPIYPLKPTMADWARLAAYIDGEGTIFIQRATERDTHQLKLAIVNTDERLTAWLKATFSGCTDCVKETGFGRRPVFRWIVGRKKAAYLLECCLPFFVFKREQAEIALAFQKTVKFYKPKQRRAGLPPEVVEQREKLRLELQKLKQYQSPKKKKSAR